MSSKTKLANQVVNDSYRAMGIVKKPSLRTSEQAQTRAAIACAMVRNFHTTDISLALEKDRTTVSYYKRMHENNVVGWRGYEDKYKIAKSIAEGKILIDDVRAQIIALNKQLSHIESRKEELLTLIKSQP